MVSLLVWVQAPEAWRAWWRAVVNSKQRRREGITVAKRGARRTLEIGYWRKDSIWCVTTASGLCELEM